MENLNLPPFYVGQKVVRLNDTPKMKKGTVVTVTGQFKCGCGEWHIHWGEYHNMPGPFCLLCNCRADIINMAPQPLMWSSHARFFAPLQEQTYPLISLKKVVEENRELVSAN